MKMYMVLLALLCSVSSHALEALDDVSIANVTAQAGADLSLNLSLNHDSSDNFDCSNLVYCRLGLLANNRYHDGSQDTLSGGVVTPSATGRKQWIVFKGIQGTVNFTKVGLDGTQVQYNSNPSINNAAIAVSFTTANPIQIRHLGFQSLAIETDTCTEANTNCSTGTTNLPGYLVPATLYGGTGFDATRERGFMGLDIHGDLAVRGKLLMFSCGATHPRCS